MKTTVVSNWQQFMSLTAELDGWAFRGQQDANWVLQSSLSRYLAAFVPDRSTWRIQEQRAIRIFRRKAHNYLSDVRALSDDLRCLGLMQHHGATRFCCSLTEHPSRSTRFLNTCATSPAGGPCPNRWSRRFVTVTVSLGQAR